MQRVLVLMDRSGVTQPLKVPAGLYEAPRLSPNGRQIAVGTDDGKDANIWVADASGATAMRRLSFGGRNRYPIWSPDGQWIAYQSDREKDLGIFWQRADGTGPAERLTKAEANVEHRPESWSPDSARILVNVVQAASQVQPGSGRLDVGSVGSIRILDVRERTLTQRASSSDDRLSLPMDDGLHIPPTKPAASKFSSSLIHRPAADFRSEAPVQPIGLFRGGLRTARNSSSMKARPDGLS